METKLKLNFMELPLRMSIGLLSDETGDYIKKVNINLKVKDFMLAYTDLAREHLYRLTRQDLVIIDSEMSFSIFDVFTNSFVNENGERFQGHFWFEVKSGNNDLDTYIMNELVRQNLKG